AKGDREARLLQITTNPGPDAAPSWSGDGKWIAHTSNTETGAKSLYGTYHLAVSSSSGGDSKLLTRDLDRMISQPRFPAPGDAITFLLEEGGELNLARISASGGDLVRLVRGADAVSAFDLGPSDAIAALVSNPPLPAEVFVLTAAGLER